MNIFQKELLHFRSLRSDTRALLISVFMASACAPLLLLFANAYLWGQRADIPLLVVYNTSIFVTIPGGFYLVGLLMRRFNARYLYALGFVAQGVVVTGLVLVRGSGYFYCAIFGGLFGLVAGAYWGARHLLSLTVTRDRERDYYCGLEVAVSTLFNIVMPYLFGALIEDRFFIPNHLDEAQAYLLLLLIALAFMVWAAKRIAQSSLAVVAPASLRITVVSPHWRSARGFIFCKGLANGGATFLPVLLALTMFGTQSSLGAVQSFSAMFTAFFCYVIGRVVATSAHRFSVLAIGTGALVCGGIWLAVSFNRAGVVVFTALYVFGWALTWNAANPLTMNAVQRVETSADGWYRYFCDRETLLSAGRIIGIMLFFGLFSCASPEVALRVTPISLAVSQLLVLRAGKILARAASADEAATAAAVKAG